jgi:hypothetical protein
MKEAAVTRTVDGAWVSYSGTARLGLAIVLVAAAAGIVYAGTRLRRPVRLPHPGQTATGIMAAAWLLAITAFLACAGRYVRAMRQHHLLAHPAAASHHASHRRLRCCHLRHHPHRRPIA